MFMAGAVVSLAYISRTRIGLKSPFFILGFLRMLPFSDGLFKDQRIKIKGHT
jgi:hypothetical protein